jgi:NADPH:quinone reductase-like Zn-dependent oxidoreductase
VYVSSGSAEKIERAKGMGAKGGINYKEKGWEKTLKGILPKERQFLDAIIDGAGGDVVEKGARLLKVCSSGWLIARYLCVLRRLRSSY